MSMHTLAALVVALSGLIVGRLLHKLLWKGYLRYGAPDKIICLVALFWIAMAPHMSSWVTATADLSAHVLAALPLLAFMLAYAEDLIAWSLEKSRQHRARTGL